MYKFFNNSINHKCFAFTTINYKTIPINDIDLLTV